MQFPVEYGDRLSLIGALSVVLFWGLLAVGEMLEELGQASHQLVAAANDVQAAFMLMLFQDFVQTAFEFTHDQYLPRIRRSYKLTGSPKQRKFEILMKPIQNLRAAAEAEHTGKIGSGWQEAASSLLRHGHCTRHRQTPEVHALCHSGLGLRRPAKFRMRRTFLGETDSRAATREILRPSRSQTLGMMISANSSVIC